MNINLLKSLDREFVKSEKEENHGYNFKMRKKIIIIISLLFMTVFLILIFKQEEFTIIVIPDTQNQVEKNPAVFDNQTKWIADNIKNLNVKFVIHLGDIVEYGWNKTHWENANRSISMLDGKVPYLVVPGNHDISSRKDVSVWNLTEFNKYFPVSRFNYSWFKGYLYGVENSYGEFSVNRENYLIISLDFCPKDDALIWADSVIKENKDKKIILFTHLYMGVGNERINPFTVRSCKDYLWCQNTSCNTGEDIWNKVVKNHNNIILVLSGHAFGPGKRTDCIRGKQVHQIGQNYQYLQDGGPGLLRYYIFRPSKKIIEVRTYSPLLNMFYEDYENQFELKYEKC